MTAHLRPTLTDLPVYVPGRTVPGAVKLASNETTARPLPSVAAAVADAATRVNRYPDNGCVELRRALGDALGVTSDRVAVGCGSVSLCQELVQITADAGDEVIFAWRSFEAYPSMIQVAGATPVPVPLTADHAHDLDAMAAAVTDRTRLIFVCNPNNPTGRSLTATEIVRFLDAVPAHVLVVLDEAYFEYVRPGEDGTDDVADDVADGVAIADGRPNVVVLRTFSKAYGLAGLRVGYAVAAPEIVSALGKVRTPFAVNSVAQAAAIASLEASHELLARTDTVAAERSRVREALMVAGYEVPESNGNFLWLPLSERTAAFAAAAEAAGVLVRAFVTEGVRVTVVDDEVENDTFLTFATGPGLQILRSA